MAIKRKQEHIYHGSPEIVTKPEIRVNEKRTLDFGYGFYCTTSQVQAKKWARTKLRKLNRSEGYVNVFAYNHLFPELNVKNFGLEPSIDWLDFVVDNRSNSNPKHNFDVIIGPVADDTAYSAIDTYLEEGDTSIERKKKLIKELKTYKLKDQILFHSDKALAQLKYIKSLKVVKVTTKQTKKPLKGKKLWDQT